MKESRVAIAAILVTFKKDELLKSALTSVNEQSLKPNIVFVVDNAQAESTKAIALAHNAIYLAGENQYGGAGGFAHGLKEAMSRGFKMFWLLDDDGRASKTCLENLFIAREKYNLEIVGPLSVSLNDDYKTANPVVLGIKKNEDVLKLQKLHMIPNKAQFFNGILFSIAVIEKIGLPDKRLFIRGDEIDFNLRCKRFFTSGLITNAIYYHPSSENEYPGKRTAILSANIPLDSVKKFYQFRNRGYIIRRHHQYQLAIYDWIRYPLRFLVLNRFDLPAFLYWSRTWLKGFRYDLSPFESSES